MLKTVLTALITILVLEGLERALGLEAALAVAAGVVVVGGGALLVLSRKGGAAS